MPFETEEIILEHLSSLVLSQFKKYHPSENLKFNNLGIFQGLKLRILTEKNPYYFSLSWISLLNTLGCYGLGYSRGQRVSECI